MELGVVFSDWTLASKIPVDKDRILLSGFVTKMENVLHNGHIKSDVFRETFFKQLLNMFVKYIQSIRLSCAYWSMNAILQDKKLAHNTCIYS